MSDDYTAEELDFSVLSSNHPDDNYLTALYADDNSVGLQPHSIHGLNQIGRFVYENFGVPTTITGGAERWTHAGGKYSHHTGDKADIVMDGVTPDTDAGQALIDFCHANGYSCNYEDAGSDNAHWDIDFTGHDHRDPQTGANPLSFADIFGAAYAKDANYFLYGDPTPDLPEREAPPEDIGTIRATAENFWDSLTESGLARALEYTWGGIMHSGKWWYEKKDPVTQEDIDYVQQALSGDKDGQQFVLLNGRDSQEIRWLVNQKLVEKNRKAQIAKWKEQNDGILANLIVGGGGVAGWILDPMNLVPMGSAAKSAMLLGRLGRAIMNPAKAKQIAAVAARTTYEVAKMNAPLVGSSLANSYLKETFSGNKQEYVYDAATAVLAGTVLGVAGYGLGRALHSSASHSRALPKGSLAEDVSRVADRAETQAYLHAARDIQSETIGAMQNIHDASFGQKIKSALYDKFEGNGRIVATTYEQANRLIARAIGRDLPRDTKAFYVPNEDYTVLITDNIKDTSQVESLLAHEFGVHAGLRGSLGEEGFSKLLADVQKYMNKKHHIFHKLRMKYNTQDPEEVFAHAVEDGELPAGFVDRVRKGLNRLLADEGHSGELSKKDMMDILKTQAERARQPEDYHVNPDGSTAFAGIRFSRDNLLNPHLWEDIYTLEPTVRENTQKDLGTHLPRPLRTLLQKLGKGAEQGIYGLMANSQSRTAHTLSDWLFGDVRGRGTGSVKTLAAEDQKDAVLRRLSIPHGDYIDARWRWIRANKKLPLRSAQLIFDHMVTMHYNAKYAGNTATVLTDVPKEVEEAVEAMRRYRQMQIDIGKKSAEMFGSRSDNLIDKDWYEVDEELWRVTDMDARERFFAMYNSRDATMKDLEEYYRTFAKRDVIRAKMERDIKMKNARIDAKNKELAKKGIDPIERVDETVTDDMVEEWLEARIPAAVKHTLQTNLDPTATENIGKLGELSFLQTRIPMDTSGVMKCNAGTPNEFSFSFDNNLRSYDLDTLMRKNMQRFAGEIAAKNAFGTEENLQKALAAIRSELEMSVAHGDANASVMNEVAQIEEAVKELRGQRPREDAMTRIGAVARLLQNLSYVKNGANMGFAQLGEIGGAIAYGGAARIFGAIPMLRDLVANIRHGKITAEAYRAAEHYMYGRSFEAEIWKTRFADTTVRDALTQKGSTLNKGIIAASDLVNALGKVTSTLNMLPKMTESMYRDMRTGFLVDAIKWAAGEEVSKWRNPFSKAKMKASHVSEEMAQRIKDRLNAAVKRDGNGNIVSFDMEGWLQKDPESYFKFYGMGQTQAERAIVSGTRQGNKNLWKNQNWMTRMLFQFKDYNLRAINAQTMRALTAGELDDAIAFGMSMATNIAAYALRIGAKGAAMYAVGDAVGAEEYYKRMFDERQLLRIAATRSAFEAPLSFGNDAYEALYGAPTIRTTVDRQQRRGENQSVEDNIADAFKQLPAIQTGISLKALTALPDILTGDATQKDLKALYKALPIPNFIPFMVYIDHVIGTSGLPKK